MQEKELRELGRAPQALPFPSFPPQRPGPAPRPAPAASGTPLPGRAGPRYLDLAVEQAGALHDLLRGHLQHLLADAILRGTTAPSPRAPRRAPRAPSPRLPAPAPSPGPAPQTRPTPTPSSLPSAAGAAPQIPHGRFPAAASADGEAKISGGPSGFLQPLQPPSEPLSLPPPRPAARPPVANLRAGAARPQKCCVMAPPPSRGGAGPARPLPAPLTVPSPVPVPSPSPRGRQRAAGCGAALLRYTQSAERLRGAPRGRSDVARLHREAAAVGAAAGPVGLQAPARQGAAGSGLPGAVRGQGRAQTPSPPHPGEQLCFPGLLGTAEPAAKPLG